MQKKTLKKGEKRLKTDDGKAQHEIFGENEKDF